MASWPSLPTGRAAKDDIVMIPARWRCEISEALAPGQQPGHSQSTKSTHSLSWPLAQRRSPSPLSQSPITRSQRPLAEGGHRRLVSPRYLPAVAQPFRMRSPLSKHVK